MSDTVKRHSLGEMVRSLAAYLPGGEIFQAGHVLGTKTNDLLKGLAIELQRAENSLALYNEEFIPDVTTVFIPEWESALGIPDECFPETDSLTNDERRQQILVKLAALGVQTIDDFRTLAIVLGFPEVQILTGIAAGVTPLSVARYTIVIAVPEGDLPLFPLSFPLVFGNEKYRVLGCLFEKLKPANCQLLFREITDIEGFPYSFPFDFVS